MNIKLNPTSTIEALIKSREIALKSTKDETIKSFIEGQLSGLQAALKIVKEA